MICQTDYAACKAAFRSVTTPGRSETMTLEETMREALAFWLSVSEENFQGPARIDLDRTETYDWGWIYYIVPINPGTSPHPDKCTRIAIDKDTGNATPVGTKGIGYAVYNLKQMRPKSSE